MSEKQIQKSNNGDKSPRNGSGNRKTAIIAGASVFIVAIVAATVILVTWMTGRSDPAPTANPAGGRGTVAQPDNIDEIVEQLQTRTPEGHFRTRMNIDWSFPSGSSPSTNAYVANPSTNTHTVYFDVVLDDSGEIVYSSPYIPIGSELKEFALDTALGAGTYSATVVYHLVDEEMNELSTLQVAVTLHIRV